MHGEYDVGMRLPMEILENIACSGLDSLESLLQWSKVDSHFKDIVIRRLGIVVVRDLSSKKNRTLHPLNYNLMTDERNTVEVNTDSFKFQQIQRLVSCYDNILLVVTTDRGYSDPLSTTLSEISKGLSQLERAKNVCFIYKTTVNFMSKFYFRELSHCSLNLRLCELHVIANRDISHQEVDMFDIDTIFETTYLHNVELLYSLNIRNGSKVIAKKLHMVKQLQVENNAEIANALQYCTCLATIEQFHLPLISKLILPPCDNLTVSNYDCQFHRDLIDGSLVRESLTLRLSARCSDPTFKNIKCPSIKNLAIEGSKNVWGDIKFIDCYFGNLRSFTTPFNTDWEDLLYSNCELLDTVEFTPSGIQSFQNLFLIPFQLKLLKLHSFGACQDLMTEIPEISSIRGQFPTVKRLEYQLASIWDLIPLQHLIIPSLTESSELFLTVNSLDINKQLVELAARSIHGYDSFLASFRWRNERIVFKIPHLKSFKVTYEPHRDHHDTIYTHPVSENVLSLIQPLIENNQSNPDFHSLPDMIEFDVSNT